MEPSAERLAVLFFAKGNGGCRNIHPTRLRRLERTRRLTKHVIRERRQMRRKLDLVCRDLVNAYRELAVKTAQLFGRDSGSQE